MIGFRLEPRSFVVRALVATALLGAVGCSGETIAPTKIHEGGGTIPEIVEQPEPSAKPAKGAKK